MVKKSASQPGMVLGGLAGALLLTAGILWIASGSALLALVFLLGIAVLLGGLFAFNRMETSPVAEAVAASDWSVTVAAIERKGEGIAITDRANRLVCANRAYIEWFGSGSAPPNLPLERTAFEELTRLAREAWRDGSAGSDSLGGDDESGETWNVAAERAGRGEDHLVWRFSKREPELLKALENVDVTGAFGRTLTRSGIEAAITSPDGVIKSVSAGFAERAAGDVGATLAGQDFVSFLRSDERERIFFAREGRGGTPQTLIHVPLEDPEAKFSPGPDQARSLMLLVDSGVGIGGGFDGGSQAGVAQLEALLGQLPLGLAMTDRDGRFLFGNDAFLRAIDREGRGLPAFPTDLVVREDKAALSDAVRRHGRGPATSGNMAVRLTTNPDEPVSLGLAGVRGLGEAAVLVSLADSHEETQLKRQVAQATKMQAVGQLAGGVAHDFNNVLTAIIGTCDLMLLRHTPGDSDYDDIQQIRANSNRAASLTRQLLAFSRQQTLRPEVLQLPDVVSEVGPLIMRLLGGKIEYQVKHDRDLGPVRADPQQLEQVIMNLAVNARDAIQSHGDGTGKISLSTRRLTVNDVAKMGSEILPAADYTVLIVQDTGGGIPAEVLPKLFEPFFTTKEQGKGTGLGLSTAYGIVKQSGGFIFADNIQGAGGATGARFTIYLPVHKGEMPAKPAEPEPVPSSDWSGGGRILLVEDEDMVRAVAERALTRAGYEVKAYSDGEEGLAAIKRGGEFDLIVSDVVMPGMDGPAMARGIREIHPDLPVLFMSGYAEEQLRKDIDIPNMHFIAKPFSVQEIGDKVADVMRRVGAR
ncbi:two-component system, cell cycle sensor histidine kinase and response regulator CckA [Altererythrobacter xiamenensis]|uniref:histidine kinase n=1 Tax=Altererythrobacter xiamenensis TaxID=1316679 RepID=A0A1Y6E5D3_9SPHN|nr:response regulator [Altererythrobacter xiamenensis]SMQ57967.1 two-component system, cell cycle sensor histidine kinase and response regulator CckA [Altererythrobacter xiamenensis]